MYNFYFYFFLSCAVLFPVFVWERGLFFPLAGISLVGIGIFTHNHFLRARQLHNNAIAIDDRNESINLLEAGLKEKTTFKNSLPSNIDNIQDLESLMERLNSLRGIEGLPVYVLDHLRKVFPRSSNILFFMTSEQGNALELVESNRESRLTALPEKNGDVFDLWVYHEKKSVIVENLEDEYRFPLEESVALKNRSIGSFIASPICFGNKVSGVIRVESARKEFFEVSDLRILSAVCNLCGIFMERLSLMKKISDSAIKDGLTGLFYRDHFIKRLREEIASAFLLRETISLLMIDIDNFKLINDAYGHTVGDAVLKEIAGIMNNLLMKEGNMLCRFGGEEFLVFLKMPKGDAIQIAEQLRMNIEKMGLTIRNNHIPVTVSIGVVSYPEDALSAEDMVFSADTFMYKAKQSGKNMVCSV